MSFNYLEIARVTEAIAKALPDEVQSVELVRFPLNRGVVADLNVGLRLKNSRRMIVFAFKQPWTGAFFLPPSYFAPAGFKGTKPIWSTAFSGSEGNAQDWNSYIQGQVLERAEVIQGDRIVTLGFANGAELRIELIPSRPNWVLAVGGEEFRWRSSLPARPGGSAEVTVREFTEKAETGFDAWMGRAYAHYLSARQAALLQTLLQRALGGLQSRLAQLIKIRAQMNESLVDAAKADALKLKAETLKGVLHELPQGFKGKRVNVGEVDLEVDPQYSVSENVTRMFTRYKKLQRTKKEVEARLGGIEEETRKITGTIGKLRGFKGDFAEFEALLKECALPLDEVLISEEKNRNEKKGDKKWREATAKVGVRRFQSLDGFAIWVGRNHKENEELVVRLARGNDMWLHLKGRPSAHVVIQVPGGKSPALETLLDAATLVAYYSGISDKDKVEVDYTFRKYVKRVPGGGGEKFLVTYTQNKTLMLKMEEPRLWRLLKQH